MLVINCDSIEESWFLSCFQFMQKLHSMHIIWTKHLLWICGIYILSAHTTTYIHTRVPEGSTDHAYSCRFIIESNGLSPRSMKWLIKHMYIKLSTCISSIEKNPKSRHTLRRKNICPFADFSSKIEIFKMLKRYLKVTEITSI